MLMKKIDIHDVFKFLDRDGDGYINMNDVKWMLGYKGKDLGDEVAMLFSHELGINESIKVSYDSFKMLFTSHA